MDNHYTIRYCICGSMGATGDISNYAEKKYIMNSMYNMTQFVVALATEHITTSHLARLFMESVQLKFGIYAVICVDTDSNFKDKFLTMVKCLDIRVHLAAIWSHKTIGVEQYHRFLDHSSKIFVEVRGTLKGFVECDMVTL